MTQSCVQKKGVGKCYHFKAAMDPVTAWAQRATAARVPAPLSMCAPVALWDSMSVPTTSSTPTPTPTPKPARIVACASMSQWEAAGAFFKHGSQGCPAGSPEGHPEKLLGDGATRDSGAGAPKPAERVMWDTAWDAFDTGSRETATACDQPFVRKLWTQGGTDTELHHLVCVVELLRRRAFGSVATLEAVGTGCPFYLDPVSWLYVQYTQGRVATCRAAAGEPLDGLGDAVPATTLTGFTARTGVGAPSGPVVCGVCAQLGHTEFTHTGPDPEVWRHADATQHQEMLAAALKEAEVPAPRVVKMVASSGSVPASTVKPALKTPKVVTAPKSTPAQRTQARLNLVQKRNQKAAKGTIPLKMNKG